MEINYARDVIDAAARDNLTETGELIEIQSLCSADAVFKSNLALACQMSFGDLDRTISSGINVIRAGSRRMDMVDRRFRARRW